MKEGGILLEATGITKSFPGVKALDGVHIKARSGRLNALLGENGAGKSTMMNILAGVYSPDAGSILLEGRPVHFKNPRQAQMAGISIIFQELNLAPGLSIAENIFMGREPLNRWGLLDYARMNGEAAALLDGLDMDWDPQTLVSQLRVGEQQVVEIAKAMSFHARALILDEPTSALSDHEITLLFGQIRRLKRAGVGLIYITHKLDELREIADEITVFRDGAFVGERRFDEVTHEEMIRMMVGRELSDLFPGRAVKAGAEVLGVRNLSLPHASRAGDWAVKDVSFAVGRGEVVGIFGLLGAGRTELLQAIFGFHPGLATGEVAIEGRRVKIASPEEAIAAGLALAPEDRKAEGLVLELSVAHNITLACLAKIERMGLLNPGLEHELAGGYVKQLRVKTPSLNQSVMDLSGGNQQKVVLAKWLAANPKILMLDEPTRGIDINAKKEIYALIAALAQSGLSVVLVSSELPEIMGLADRILVLCEGRLTAEFARDEATEENLLKAALSRATN